MSTVFNGNGSLVSATSGSSRRVTISSIANTTPIQVTATAHGFNTGDTVYQEGCAPTAANGDFQIAVINANTYSLNGTTASGSGSATTAIAIDYELQPAYTLPANGDLADVGTIGPIVEGLSNLGPYLYKRAGSYRLHYIIEGSFTTSIGSTWSASTVTTTTPGSYTMASASALFGFSGAPPAPVSRTGDLLEIIFSTTAGLPSSSQSVVIAPMINWNGGAGNVQTGSAVVLANASGSAINVPITLSALVPNFSHDQNTFDFSLGAWLITAGSVSVNLLSPYQITLKQWRPN